MDCRHFNAVAKLDEFPLPRIDDLLDQLGKSRYLTTLDLAAGYWQIQVDEEFGEKMAFVTHEGLFRVMPFGLILEQTTCWSSQELKSSKKHLKC